MMVWIMYLNPPSLLHFFLRKAGPWKPRHFTNLLVVNLLWPTIMLIKFYAFISSVLSFSFFFFLNRCFLQKNEMTIDGDDHDTSTLLLWYIRLTLATVNYHHNQNYRDDIDLIAEIVIIIINLQSKKWSLNIKYCNNVIVYWNFHNYLDDNDYDSWYN